MEYTRVNLNVPKKIDEIITAKIDSGVFASYSEALRYYIQRGLESCNIEVK